MSYAIRNTGTDGPAPLTQEVCAALNASNKRSERLYSHLLTEYPASRRADLGTRWLLLCLDHREAFLLLQLHGARSSAAALLRPIFESYARGYWAINVASDAQLEQVARHELPKFETVTKQTSEFLDRALQTGQHVTGLTSAEVAARRGCFGEMKRKAWGHLSDFSHGGMSQLANWINKADGTIGPSHQDRDVLLWLGFVDLQAVLACTALFDVAGLEAPNELAQIASEIQGEIPG